MLSPYFGFRGLWDDRSLLTLDNGPHYEARESADALRIEIEVPRYRSEDITVNTDSTKGIITVNGARPTQHADAAAKDVDQLLVSSSPMTNFRRSFRLSSSVYNLGGIQVEVANGLLSITIPKLPQPPVAASTAPASDGQGTVAKTVQPAPLVLFGGHSNTATATQEEMNAIRRDRNLMLVKKSENETALSYDVVLSPNVTQEHIDLELVGRLLRVCVNYQVRTEHTSDAMTYETSFTVPVNTRAEDVHTEFIPGHLKITLDKPAGAQPAVPVRSA